MYTKPASVPMPFWLYYFNVGAIDDAAERVRAAGGKILKGPMELPGGNLTVHCADPQGAVFALLGNNGIGFFEPAPRPKQT
jgi:predicted enzyme related to lactoylglutathione lyase